MKLIGIDPGLAACGVAIVDITSVTPRVITLNVVRTAPSAKKRRLRSADDLGDRVRGIATVLRARLEEHRDLVAICVEAAVIPVVGGRMRAKPSILIALGRVRGLLDAFAVERGLPIIEETAQTLKLLTAGRRDASKADVQAALELRFPEVKALWPTQKTLIEHAADALAAVVAGLESDVVRAALRARDLGQPRLTCGLEEHSGVIRDERQAANQRRDAGGPGDVRAQGDASAHGEGGTPAAREPGRAHPAELDRATRR